jgi:glycosyltransferase involved in cell wall biosynthesis
MKRTMDRRPLRVLLLCDRLDIAGGVERFVSGLANHLAAEGMDVAIGSVDTPAAEVRYPLRQGVRVLSAFAERSREPAAAGWRRPFALLRTQWRTGRALARLTHAEQPDVVVLNGLTTACSTLLLSRRFAACTICCDHNHFTARSAFWQALRRRLYPHVAAVVSLSAADEPKFKAINPHTVVIYNASGLGSDEPGLPARPLVLAVGRHVAQKGFDLLLQAWAMVAKTLPDATLRVIGEGPLRGQHVALAARLGITRQVEWVAPTQYIVDHYRDAALFVLPSRYEGMPLALLEAQALGVPAVAFDCPTGPAEILTPETGRLVPAGDVDGLARVMVELLQSPELRQRMAFAAIARSRAVFSPQGHLQRWTALVRDVASAQLERVTT